MVRTVVLHRVKDYAAWRSVYDEVISGPGKDAGIRDQSVSRSLEDSNDLLVTHDFDDAAAANAWFSSTTLHDTMARAGVDGPPQLIWTGTLT